MKIIAQHLVAEKTGHRDPTHTIILVHELADGTYYKGNPWGFFKPITDEQFKTMEDTYDDMTDE